MMPYGDAEFQETKTADPELSMPDQDDAPTPEKGYKCICMGVLFPRGYGYQRATVAHRKRNVDG